MKKTLIAASVALGLASSGASWAGGIQIDPTGTGNVGASKFLSDASLGSTFGNLLVQDILGTIAEQGAGATRTGTVYGHNSLGLSSFGIAGAELTLEFELAVNPTVTDGVLPGPNSVGEQLSFLLDATRTSKFRLYFDSTADANMAAGTGYSDGTLIAASTGVTIQGSAALTNTTGGITPGNPENPGKLDDQAGAVDTIGSNGSIFLDINFSNLVNPPPAPADPLNFVNANFIVNDLTAVMVDLTTDNSLITPYPNGTFASALVVGKTLDEGGDAINNFRCIGATVLGACDFQAKMNTTFIVDANQVPEPGSVALLGIGLAVFGLGLRRRSGTRIKRA